nr:NADH-quinone oxidoreductase subunit A [Candidatus Njordarchaeum guaymaensis]
MTEILGIPIIAFLLCLMFALFLYWVGRRMAPAGKKTKDKEASYACGEDVPAGNVQFYVHRFYYAIFFVIFEAAAFMIFTGIAGGSITPVGLMLMVLYTVLLFVAVVAVPIWRAGEEKEW